MEKTDQQKALEIAKVLQDEKANDVAVLDISGLNSWTDYFVIATVNSAVHSQGLYKSIKEYISENDMEIHKTVRKSSQGEDWNLIDLGNVVIHLMSEEARGFYELEKLWHAGVKLM
ncbi:MAG: ribosome silencing factor [Treponema sp.]|nr:ribosome silencing factor [Treponema sp.]MBR7079806.1 ribosome silencing factor [Treponema sp.]